MDFIYSAANRVAQIIGLSSNANNVEQPKNSWSFSPWNRVQGPASRTRDIFHIAFLLHHKLPADLVPIILEYAELWESTRLAYRHYLERIRDDDSPRLYTGAIIPYHLPRGSIRVVRFKIVSRDQGWSDHHNDHNTYNNSWTWFEAGIVGFDEALGDEHHGYGNDYMEVRFPRPGPYKYGSKRIVTNLHAHRDFLTHTVEWRYDDKDDDIRRMIRELKGGCGIEVAAFAQFQGWCNEVKSVSIEIDCPVVRKM